MLTIDPTGAVLADTMEIDDWSRRDARRLKRALRTHAETSETVILQSLESLAAATKRPPSSYRALRA